MRTPLQRLVVGLAATTAAVTLLMTYPTSTSPVPLAAAPAAAPVAALPAPADGAGPVSAVGHRHRAGHR